MSASELKASEMPFCLSIKTLDPKPEEKAPQKHKVPLTAAGKPLGQQQGWWGVVIDGQGVRS